MATGAFRRSQIVTRYANGLVVAVNGHPTETWKTPEMVLPPNGWHVKDTRDGKLIGLERAWSTATGPITSIRRPISTPTAAAGSRDSPRRPATAN